MESVKNHPARRYLLRSNVHDWSDEELWKAYIQLTEAESAFRIHKSDLRIRPIALQGLTSTTGEVRPQITLSGGGGILRYFGLCWHGNEFHKTEY
jgi:hypothetical protein